LSGGPLLHLKPQPWWALGLALAAGALLGALLVTRRPLAGMLGGPLGRSLALPLAHWAWRRWAQRRALPPP
jgi:hypothetical protein